MSVEALEGSSQGPAVRSNLQNIEGRRRPKTARSVSQSRVITGRRDVCELRRTEACRVRAFRWAQRQTTGHLEGRNTASWLFARPAKSRGRGLIVIPTVAGLNREGLRARDRRYCCRYRELEMNQELRIRVLGVRRDPVAALKLVIVPWLGGVVMGRGSRSPKGGSGIRLAGKASSCTRGRRRDRRGARWRTAN